MTLPLPYLRKEKPAAGATLHSRKEVECMKRFAKGCLLLSAILFLTGCHADPVPETTAPTSCTVEETMAAATEAATVPSETEPVEERFLLTFVGDCTFGASPANYYAGEGFIKTMGEDYGYPFRNLIDYFREDECSFINLEGPLTDVGNPVQKTHIFHGPSDYIRILTENSVEFASLANNHALDYGQSGYDSTVNLLQDAGIPYVERDASTVFITKNGLTIGVYGAVYYHLDMEDMVTEITALKDQGCDLVIYAPHWGVEKTNVQTAQQTEFAYAAIDAGADIVWASHPHALQPIEYYEDGVIFYSLGNFSFGGFTVPQDFDTALLQQEIIRDGEGQISLGQLTIVPCCISSIAGRNNYQPTPYAPETEDYSRVLEKLGVIDVAK